MDETRSRTLARDETTMKSQEAIPLAEEELVVDRQKVERGRVRVTKTVREHEALVQDSVLREEVEVQRVAIDRVVQQAPEVRYEADVLVIPIVEEVAVVHKQLVLKEELRVRKRSRQTPHEERVTLRTEEAVVERMAGEDGKA
jgi:uncharacterized protein (TIGR02271 family)